MAKIDLTKEYKNYFTAPTHPEVTHFDTTHYISIIGKGDPSDKQFSDNIQLLYSTAYALKFIYKLDENDFVVSKLEGLWWYDDTLYPNLSMDEASVKVPRSEWNYRLLIRIPDFVSEEAIEKAKHSVMTKKKLLFAQNVAFFTLTEGQCVQMMHIGSFASEVVSLQQMRAFIQKKEFSANGLHHEIYLSDFRKVAPEQLRTILREPVR